MKGWVGLVGWPTADGLPTWVHPSAAGRAQDRESSPVKDRRSTNCATQPTCGCFIRCDHWTSMCSKSTKSTFDCLVGDDERYRWKRTPISNVTFTLIIFTYLPANCCHCGCTCRWPVTSVATTPVCNDNGYLLGERHRFSVLSCAFSVPYVSFYARQTVRRH